MSPFWPKKGSKRGVFGVKKPLFGVQKGVILALWFTLQIPLQKGSFWRPLLGSKKGSKIGVLGWNPHLFGKVGYPKSGPFCHFWPKGPFSASFRHSSRIGCPGGGPKWGQKQAKKGHFGPPLLYKSRKRAILTLFGPFWGSKKGSFLDPDLATSR